MKKIIATVLAMVMALALCSTAFAAGVTGYVKGTEKGAVLSGEVTLDFTAAKDPTVNADGETTAKGHVAYYTYTVAGDTQYYVTVDSLAAADLVLYNNNTSSKSVVMYLDRVVPQYLVGKAISFGTACGQYMKPTGYVSSNTYYVAEEMGDDVFFYTNSSITPTTPGVEALLVDGKLVNVLRMTSAIATVKHSALPTVKDGKIVGYTCSVCKMAAIEAPNYASIPAGAQIITGNWYFPAAAASTTTTTSSPKTFDAGIAMYVGMALTSVAGSAVVIGKKKEF